MCNPVEKTVRGVIFDMDGVLCDSEPFICEAGRKMLAERYGLNTKPEDFIPFTGTGEDSYLAGPAEKYGCRIKLPEDKDRTYEIYLQIIRGRLKPLAGAKEFIAGCRAGKIRLAVATSADEVKMKGNLLEIGIPPGSFEALVCGNEVALKKPNPDIFLRAAAKLGLPAKSCLVIEDSPSGLRAARSAGMRALGLTTSFKAEVLESAGADWTAPDLARLPGNFPLAGLLDK